MKKIAMLNCLNANRVCAGAACFQALNSRTKSFEQYRQEEVEVVAYMRCNGCDMPLKEDAGMMEKLERLSRVGTEVVHMGLCTVKEKKECPLITDAAAMLASKGIRVVRGTH